ncbi:VOC family protein [Aurantiacibacter poecillastricola]|uniref:VOC family protein n=1 Tax=Aurantiacibacter poecillastricola TaxID=3064385 RepID=UPI00273FE321|nr:VOC family protein [Aurantiacibacter sp. 219JJ12-13]MDP5262182.1 VOC family protein [Aurantiacibacter sp. 219JJ12-13]
MAVLDYVELPVTSVATQSAFYSQAFGWNFTAYGETYAAHEDGPCQFALNGTGAHQGAAALPVVRVEDIEAALTRVKDAGGAITLGVFDYPGGRRFHFTDPEGREMAVYEPA